MAPSSAAAYEVVLSEDARSQWYRAEPRRLRRALWRTLEDLSRDPRPPAALQLVGSSRYWLAVDSAVVLYAVDEAAATVLVAEIRI
ncbi:MAG: hypothetical protein R3190_03720 [Thermoanaerobaculia bacterium]|nr:hypothetical protein [Thermoanaerobaculia bacterium]